MNKPSEVIQRISEICIDTFYHSDIMDLEQAKTVMQNKVANFLLNNDLNFVENSTMLAIKERIKKLESDFLSHNVGHD